MMHLQPTPRLDPAVWLMTALLIGGGVAFARGSAPPAHTVTAFDGAVTATVPSGWASYEEEGHLLIHKPTIDEISPTVEVRPLETDGDPLFADLALARLHHQRAETGVGYRVLHAEDRPSFGGHQASFTHYAIVQDPPGVEPGAAVLPLLVVGVDVLVLTDDGRAYHVASYETRDTDDDTDLERLAIVEEMVIR